IQVKAEKLPFFITVEIHFAVDRMDRSPVALAVPGQYFSVLPVLVTRQAIGRPIVLTATVFGNDHVLPIERKIDTAGTVKIRALLRDGTVFEVDEVQSIVKIKGHP